MFLNNFDLYHLLSFLGVLALVAFGAATMTIYFRKKLIRRTDFLKKEIRRRKNIEKRLRSTNDMFKLAQKIGRFGNWEYNISKKTFRISDEAKDIWGLNPNQHEFSIQDISDCIPENEKTATALSALIHENKPYDIEYEILRQNDGSSRFIHALAMLEAGPDNKPSKVVGIVQNITERTLDEGKQNQAKMLLDQVGSIAKIGGWEHNLLTREVTWTNETYKIIELDPSQPPPSPDERLSYYPEKDREKLENGNETAKKTGVPFDLELRCNTAKGNSIWARVVGYPIIENGSCIKMRGFFQDITERKELKEKLLHSQRLESMSTLSKGIAHDFNNILSAILGFNELAREAHPDDTQLQDDLDEVEDAGNRGKKLVQQLHYFSHKQEGENYPIFIPEIILETVGIFKASASASIEIITRINEEVPFVKANPTHIHQIVMDICTNAFQAMEQEGGQLVVAADTITLTNHHILEPGMYVKITFTDDGPGIPSEILNLVFDPYFSTKHYGDGDGLGLAIAYGIITDLGGDISVSSELGKGSEFTILLPVIDYENVSSTNSILTAHSGERLLLIEEDTTKLKKQALFFENKGYQVTSAPKLAKGLILFSKNPFAYDIITASQQLPVGDKATLSEKIQMKNPNIPLLFIDENELSIPDIEL